MSAQATISYLVNYGANGEFGLFSSGGASTFGRGDRVVVRSSHGLECGVVLCSSTEGHRRFLSGAAGGELLRRLNEDDIQDARRRDHQAGELFQEACRQVRALGLPLEVVDARVTLDGETGLVYHLQAATCDYRPLVSALSRQFDLNIFMESLAAIANAPGCGRPGCGQDSGGCTSCGSGGCGASCGKGARPEEVSAMLAMMSPAASGPKHRIDLL